MGLERVSQVLDIDTDAEVIALALNVPDPNPQRWQLRQKLEAATTTEECWKVCNAIPGNSQIKNKALEKIISLTNMVEQLWKVYYNTRNSQIQERALEKIFPHVLTVKECWRVCHMAPKNSRIKERALKKIISLATTTGECRDVYLYCRETNSCLSSMALAVCKIDALIRERDVLLK